MAEVTGLDFYAESLHIDDLFIYNLFPQEMGAAVQIFFLLGAVFDSLVRP